MPTITFAQWGFGLDLRKGASTADANRLRVLKNAYITDGKTIRKRPGLTRFADLTPGTVGLFGALGVLNTFRYSGVPAVAHANSLVVNRTITPEFVGGATPFAIYYCDTFNGFLYVASSNDSVPFYANHHYLDGTPNTRILDVNCPPFRQIAKAASKIWVANGDNVRFCATNNPRNWTLANDAGFLPVGLQQTGSRTVTAIGNYQNRLVPFFADSAQIWQVDPDPANHQFLQSVDIGTTRPYAHQNMSGDVFFQSPGGIRTITRQQNTDSLIDSDVGSPIDAEFLARGLLDDIDSTRAEYFRGAGQYWLYYGTKALVFTFSRSSKISAWSLYEFPFWLDYVTELDAELYIRSGNVVYKVDRSVWTDDGALYEVLMETPFVDFKTPGVDKQIISLDAVFTGTGDVSHRYDPRSPSLVTAPPVTITGDTQPGNLYPVELITTNLATVIRNYDDQEFEVHSFSYKYETLR